MQVWSNVWWWTDITDAEDSDEETIAPKTFKNLFTGNNNRRSVLIGQGANAHIDSVLSEADFSPACTLSSTFIVSAATVVEEEPVIEDEVVSAYDTFAMEAVEKAMTIPDDTEEELVEESRTGLSLNFICDTEIQCKIVDVQRRKQQPKKPSIKRKQINQAEPAITKKPN